MSSQYRRTRADEREARTGMRQSTGAMIAKIAFGLMFILVCFDDSEDALSFGATMVGLCMGGALLAWGLLPYLEARRKRKAREATEEAARTAQILNAPLRKFSDNGGVSDEKVEQLAQKYGSIPKEVNRKAPKSDKTATSGNGAPKSGIDWNRDGQLDWKDSALEKEILRQEAVKRGIDSQ